MIRRNLSMATPTEPEGEEPAQVPGSVRTTGVTPTSEHVRAHIWSEKSAHPRDFPDQRAPASDPLPSPLLHPLVHVFVISRGGESPPSGTFLRSMMLPQSVTPAPRPLRHKAHRLPLSSLTPGSSCVQAHSDLVSWCHQQAHTCPRASPGSRRRIYLQFKKT